MIYILAGNSQQANWWARDQRLAKDQYRIVNEPYFPQLCGVGSGAVLALVGTYWARRDALEAVDYAKARGMTILSIEEKRPAPEPKKMALLRTACGCEKTIELQYVTRYVKVAVADNGLRQWEATEDPRSYITWHARMFEFRYRKSDGTYVYEERYEGPQR